jgi:DNA-binding transcriptional MerR regulator
MTTTTAPRLLIGEAASLAGLSVDTLRYYDRAGLLGPLHRDSGGRRVFDPGALGVLDVVLRLRRSGMPVEDVRRFAELLRDGDARREGRLALLREHRDRVRERIDALRSDLAVVEWKIAAYEAAEAGRPEPEPPAGWPDRNASLDTSAHGREQA